MSIGESPILSCAWIMFPPGPFRRVNSVAPTYINTPLTAFAKTNKPMFDAWIDGTPMARMGEPDEIAAVVMFLASDAASLMTGSVVLADGGYSCW